MSVRTDWIKTLTILAVLFIASRLVPQAPVDPWGLFSPRAFLKLLLALSLIQVIGKVMVRFLGSRAGMLAAGFLGGLVSSTALTMSLARKSRDLTREQTSIESLSFLSATLAMALEALVLVYVGSAEFHRELWLIFLGPIVVTLLLITARWQKLPEVPMEDGKSAPLLELRQILKLTVFIAAILAVSKITQNIFGNRGLEVLTFAAALFEIHGTVIANVQLHEAGAINVALLVELLFLSLAASYISKLIIVFVVGSAQLKRRVAIWTSIILVSLLASLVLTNS